MRRVRRAPLLPLLGCRPRQAGAPLLQTRMLYRLLNTYTYHIEPACLCSFKYLLCPHPSSACFPPVLPLFFSLTLPCCFSTNLFRHSVHPRIHSHSRIKVLSVITRNLSALPHPISAPCHGVQPCGAAGSLCHLLQLLLLVRPVADVQLPPALASAADLAGAVAIAGGGPASVHRTPAARCALSPPPAVLALLIDCRPGVVPKSTQVAMGCSGLPGRSEPQRAVPAGRRRRRAGSPRGERQAVGGRVVTQSIDAEWPAIVRSAQ